MRGNPRGHQIKQEQEAQPPPQAKEEDENLHQQKPKHIKTTKTKNRGFLGSDNPVDETELPVKLRFPTT